MDAHDDSNIGDLTLSSGRQLQPRLPWITFNGTPDESSGDFIQAVQRLAFRQGRADDDRWIAQYASTCFNGRALLWYSELESETRESWAMLRLAFLRHYPLATQRASISSSYTPASWVFERVGIIKVLDKNSYPLGFVSFDQISGTTIITKDLQKSVWVGLPTGQASELRQLYMMSVPRGEAPSCLGLALLPSQSGNPDIAPKELAGIEREFSIASGRLNIINVPQPSPRCRGSGPNLNSLLSYTDLATWVFAACKERTSPSFLRRSSPRPEERMAAMVWQYDKNGSELKPTWTTEDGDNCELGGFIHRDTSGELHFHRISDMQPYKIAEYIQEDQVRFLLRPEEYRPTS